jgi:pimeloyl-ACP methyl ester carboxylesterase
LPPLVFIHGIKGSSLLDQQGKGRWLTSWQAFGLEAPDLRLPLKWNGDIQERDNLIARAPLRRIAWVDIYAPFLDWAETLGRPFYPFAYDWRRDNLENVDKFLSFLESVRERNQGAKPQVVAHSMGGLIGFVALNRRPDLFHSVLFAGVPFGDAISLFEDLHAGTANGFNKRILCPQVMFTFASPYFVFPLDPNKSRLTDEKGNSIPHDWYSVEDWERQRLGLFGYGKPGITDQELSHLRNALRRAKEFRSQFVCQKEDSFQYPPIAVLAGNTVPTLSTVVRNGPHAVRGWDFRSAPREPGDRRVIFPEALPPKGVPFTLYESSHVHVVLLNDTRQVGGILTELCKAYPGEQA